MNVWVRYLFVKEILLKGTISEATKWQKVNIAGIILGFLSALGISMVANFQVRDDFLYIIGYFRSKVLVYPLELWIESTHPHNTNETLSSTRSCFMYRPKIWLAHDDILNREMCKSYCSYINKTIKLHVKRWF